MIWYLIEGIDADGRRHHVARASSARAACIYRDAKNNPWVRTNIYGPSGLLSANELDRLAETGDSLAVPRPRRARAEKPARQSSASAG